MHNVEAFQPHPRGISRGECAGLRAIAFGIDQSEWFHSRYIEGFRGNQINTYDRFSKLGGSAPCELPSSVPLFPGFSSRSRRLDWQI